RLAARARPGRPPLLLGGARAIRLVGLGLPGGRVTGNELTIGRWLADRARLTPDRVAIRFLGGELTYAALDGRATRLAAGLAERGLRRDDRLATLTQTSPDHVAT